MEKVQFVHDLFVGSCEIIVVSLVVIAVVSIVLFLKVFQGDFGQAD